MANNNLDDWEDLPITSEQDDWEEVPVESNSFIDSLKNEASDLFRNYATRS